jgi:5-methylcytosine-specific restriction enzyme subunit McrC
MLMVAHNLDVRDGDIARLATQQNGILEILIGLFCERLFAQLRRGVIRQYDPCEGNFAVLRGKLLVSEQLRLNAAHPERLYCRFDELHEDIPLNQIFKAAIRLLLQVSRDLNNQRQLLELLLALEGISDVATPLLEWNKVNFNRLNDRYRPAFGLAKLFLKGTPPDVTSGFARGFSLFFDMNTLFEQYVGRIAMRAFRPFGVDVRLQGPQRYLAFDELSGANAFAMKPDVIGISNGRAKWIIDCKWKQLSEDDTRQGVQQADLYQMYAYANNYHCPNVVLLYPHHLALRRDAGVMATYTLHQWVGNARGQIRVATVDLSDLRTMQSQLCALFPDTVAALEPVDERCTA